MATTATTGTTVTRPGKSSDVAAQAGIAGSSGRVVLIPLEAGARRTLVLVLTLVIAAALAITIVRPAIARYLTDRADTSAALERALAWDPTDGDLRVRLGRVYEADGAYGEARSHFGAALRLRPTDAYAMLELALLADREHDLPGARKALDAALRLDPHNVSIRWDAALLHFRWGDREGALEHFRYVLAVDPSQRDAAFHLARTLLGPGEDPGSLLPSEPAGLTNVLLAALQHEDLVLAEVAWSRRAKLEPPLPEATSKAYLSLLLDRGEGAMARRLWLSLVPDGNPAAQGNAVWNGGFETERLLGWGLDWRVRRVWGVDVALDRFVVAQGSRSLRLTFNSFPTLNFAGVTQLVPVEPGREYRLRALAKALDFTTQSGLKLQVVVPGPVEQLLAETPAISGTTPDWVPLETRVTIPSGTALVSLRVRRQPAPEPEGNLGGKVWIDEVSLQ